MAIFVDIRAPGLDIGEHWDDLVRRAPANVFMHPAALNAAFATKFAKVHVLLAWDEAAQPRKLAGLWALQERDFSPLWPSFLAAPPYTYAFVSNPVVDPAYLAAVIPAFFDAIDRHPALPTVISLKSLDGDSASYEAIVKALAARGSHNLKLAESARPFAPKDTGVKRSGSTRKKLRQDWNRLSALGAPDVVNERAHAAVREAFEVFLAMEAGSWKGAGGTALLSSAEDAAFTRRLIGDLAAQGNASVALLRVAGRPVAAQVLLYCGTMAYTWKTAFDAEYGKFSPGALLVDKVTEELFATGSIEAIESCSPEGSFMGQLWAGRRATIDLLVDVSTRTSLNFILAALAERGYAQLRGLRNRLRAMQGPRTKKSAAAG